MGTESDNLHNAEGNEKKVESTQNLESTYNKNSSKEDSIDELNSENNKEDQSVEETTIPEKDYESFSLEKLIDELKYLHNHYPVQLIGENINSIRDIFLKKFDEHETERKQKFLNEGGDELSYQPDQFLKNKFNSAYHDYKTKLNSYYKEQEQNEQNNLNKRLQIIEELKELYTTPMESISSFFKKFRDIKERWHNAGKIPKSRAGDVFRTYFHHLDNTHEFIKLNKELEELDYAHNLEQRRAIISRAEELTTEPSVQKALNELQYLHKLWKEQAEPVAEEFRESTWQEFKAITQKIHERKSELFEKIKEEQQANLEKKQAIISQLETIASAENPDHSFWQNNVKKIENLREAFFTTGRIPKETSSDTWSKFKSLLHEINNKKNTFYKDLKKIQQENLKKKNDLLEIAKANKDSEDWEVALNLYKKIQNEWKNIGHVPRKYSDKLWDEFRENCNYFFNRYKLRNNKVNEEWIENLKRKQSLLEEISSISATDKEDALAKINDYSIQWNSIGKVPRENMNINKEFNSAIKNLIKKFDIDKNIIDEIQLNIKVENYKQSKDDKKLDEDLRKMRKQIQDLGHEIVQLENNLSYFSNANQDNPLLQNTLNNIESKKTKLDELKQTYSKLVNLNLSESDSNYEDGEDISEETEEE
ncbi:MULTISPECIES: DUF349 domain-containing protein [unclassified Apibacter]|uniref:DUF349 domain-containing protein n=1 Tax=unclassified Apibacter TaxID=2630820 RepID=UPI00140C24D2|nr:MULTISPECIES: DUF349 domain-containing protein [unclassified Apibacter]QII69620.1 DUF349 domain-containing protein [Apibacter sp. B3706]QII71967.1 DUF349 domain-containing protein [Apibacter sp. B2966]